MSIKIDSTRSPTPLPRNSGEPATSRVPAQGSAATGGDSVRLTGEGLLAQELTQMVAAASAVDPQRVAATRAALDEGRYQVDAPLVAAKLLRLEWELQSA